MIPAPLMVLPAYLLLALWLAFATYLSGNDIEQRLWPVLSEQEVSQVARDQERLCWTWRFVKQRTSTPLYFTWVLHGVGVPRVVQPYDPMARLSERLPRTSARPIGETIVRRCVDIPLDMRAVHVSVAGIGLYQAPHGLWTVSQPFAPVWSGPPSVR